MKILKIAVVLKSKGTFTQVLRSMQRTVPWIIRVEIDASPLERASSNI